MLEILGVGVSNASVRLRKQFWCRWKPIRFSGKQTHNEAGILDAWVKHSSHAFSLPISPCERYLAVSAGLHFPKEIFSG